MMTPTGFRTSSISALKPKSRKRIHHACLDNLHHFLEGEVGFEEWALRQEALECSIDTGGRWVTFHRIEPSCRS